MSKCIRNSMMRIFITLFLYATVPYIKGKDKKTACRPLNQDADRLFFVLKVIRQAADGVFVVMFRSAALKLDSHSCAEATVFGYAVQFVNCVSHLEKDRYVRAVRNPDADIGYDVQVAVRRIILDIS